MCIRDSTTVVEAGPQILSPLDPEMAQLVRLRMEDNGVQVRTNAQAQEITETGVVLGSGEEIPADVVVAAVGVRPASELARNAGLEVTDNGGIVVDSQLRTSDPHIFALGDAATKADFHTGEATLVPLAQTANRHGRIVADVITGRAVSYTHLTLPTTRLVCRSRWSPYH